jgi:hypothetical protein
MEYHLDSKICLSEDPEHKNLYRWFLREIGEETPKYQRDQIPWEWTQYFTLAEIQVQSSFQLGERYASDEEKAAPAVKERDVILAKLLPYDVRDRRMQSSTRYSMFGANRPITEFELSIYEVEEGTSETCSAWGSLSYTTDIDFCDVTSDDSITFYFKVTKDRFARLLSMIAAKSITGGTLRVSDVEGFYSDWSPGISTDDIKVLTRDEKDHPVEIPEGCSITPPRLGKIGEFELYLHSELKFSQLQESDFNDELDDDGSSHPAISLSDMPVARPVVDAKMLGVLKSLRIAAWIITGLLFLIFIK